MFVPPQDRISGKKVNFMATCLCDAIFTDAAKDAVKILRKYAEVAFVQDQTCCGQPAFNSGDFESARKVIRHTMGAFSANDYPIVVPSASCAAMLYHSSKIAFRDAEARERDEVDAFARRIWEFCDYLVNGLGVRKTEGKLRAKLAVHNSCHSAGSGTPEAMRILLGSVEGIELADFPGNSDCCGFGGTFSVVFPQISSEMGLNKVRAISGINPDFIVSADTSCLMHQKGLAERNNIAYPAKHVSQILYMAMKNGGQL